MFQGMAIRENVSAGILIVDQGLVIRRVSRQQSGRYSCTAVNSEGNGSSNTVLLKVMRKFNQWPQLVIWCFNFQQSFECILIRAEIRSEIREKWRTPRDGADLRIELK